MKKTNLHDLESLEIKTNTVEEEFIKYYKEDGTNE